MAQHYICDKHGILEKLIANQLKSDTNVKKDTTTADDDDLEILNEPKYDSLMDHDKKLELYHCDSDFYDREI